MKGLKWWMRIVGGFYALLFITSVFVKLPVRALGGSEVMARAAGGEFTAMFLIDT